MAAKSNAVKKELLETAPPAEESGLRVVHQLTGANSPAQLDRLIHERIRLGIVSALAVNKALTFNELKKILDTTDGNLSVHARKLEEAKYIVCEKTFEGRIPKTEYRLTTEGKKALERYLNHMEALIKAVTSDERRQ